MSAHKIEHAVDIAENHWGYCAGCDFVTGPCVDPDAVASDFAAAHVVRAWQFGQLGAPYIDTDGAITREEWNECQ